MARSIWKGAISFSLVHIPVSLHTASRANDLDLDLLDRRDFSPVGYQRVNKSTGKVVAWEDIVKGYEYRKGEHVVLTDEDFRRANVEATQTIAIRSFVREHEIPPQYFETPYYLAPEKRGQKVYALLREALRKSEAQYRLLFESNPQAMWVYDLATLRFLAKLPPAPRPPPESLHSPAQPPASECPMPGPGR